MKRLIFLTLCLFIMSCSDETSLSKFCPIECYGWNAGYKVDPTTKNVGVCRAGTPVCDKDFNVIECQDQVLPQGESCNNLDDNCNGLIDEKYDGGPLEAWGVDNPCLSFGECRKYNGICINGEYICPYQPEPEVCDGLDNDCNTITDDIEETQLCFDDEFWKVTNGVCRAGVLRCIDKEMKCYGEKLPSIELCDNKDNDCNGIIDDSGDIHQTEYDILFIVDTSGSMCEEIEAVAGALSNYIDQFQNNLNIRWGLAIMSNFYPDSLEVIKDFTDISSIQSSILNLDCNGDGIEESLGALYEGCNHLDSTRLVLSWRQNANALLFSFTDEPAQTWIDPPVTADMIIDSCIQHGVLPFQWSQNPEDFQYIVETSNGIHFDLSNNWTQIFNDMNTIIIKLCGGN